jgi:glycosyltransferase involved in cell wall biosynthesis
MTGTPRLSICYVAPNQDLQPGSSHTRHVLSLARALADAAEVSVAFRRIIGPPANEPFEISALERFVEKRNPGFDVVIEGGWPMSGKLTAWCAQHGLPAIPVVDRLPGNSWLASIDAGRGWLAVGSSGRYFRRVPAVVVGTEALRTAMIERWRVPAERIAVIGAGVDRALFAPQHQADARRRLGLATEHRILVAGDGLRAGPDLTPLIEAVQRAGDLGLRLHVLGDGSRRGALERLAGPGGAVTFHGHLPDDRVATFVAAADLCVSVDEHGDSAFTVRECLVAGRPVALGTRGERGHPLVRHLVSGFLVDHDLLGWIRFLQRDCPSRNTLRFMGVAATAVPVDGMERTALAYLDALERVHRHAPRAAAVV